MLQAFGENAVDLCGRLSDERGVGGVGRRTLEGVLDGFDATLDGANQHHEHREQDNDGDNDDSATDDGAPLQVFLRIGQCEQHVSLPIGLDPEQDQR